MLNYALIGVITFVVTNIDDLLMLSIYFAAGEYKTKNIVSGQYLGITTLILVSLSALLLNQVFETRWISLLGIFPLLLGLRGILWKKNDGEPSSTETDRSKFQFLNVALITIANGGDNIGVYAPLFATTPTVYTIMYIGLFLLLTGVWCFLGYYSVSHPLVKGVFSTYGKIILPYFLILLGLFILKGFFE